MMISIADAVTHILTQPPVPVLLIDTCSLVDLFRWDERPFRPRVPVQEIRAAADLVDLITISPDAVHLIVPELIPREFADHADREEATFGRWTAFHDQNQEWLVEASLIEDDTLFSITLFTPCRLSSTRLPWRDPCTPAGFTLSARFTHDLSAAVGEEPIRS